MSKPNWTPIQIRLGDLIPWGDNPKYSTKEDAKRLLETEQEFGQPIPFCVSPYLEGSTVNCYDGHQRDSAWRTAYGDDFVVWAMQSDRHLTEVERKRFVLRMHNAHGQWSSDTLSGWDADVLKSGWFDSNTLKGWKADVGWLDKFLQSEQPSADAEPDVDRAAELLEKWQVVPGSLWQIGEHRLICGDCTDAATVARVMDGERAVVIFTDPPYRMETQGGGALHEQYSKTAERIKDIVDFEPSAFLSTLQMYFEKGYHSAFIFCNKDLILEYLVYAKENKLSANILVWHKPVVVPFGDSHRPDIEYIIFFRHRAKWINGLSDANYSRCLEYPNQRDEMHPTVKPLELVENQLRLTSESGDIVAEPFSGSGTTLVACENLGRRCRAIEISPAYVAVALERMAQAFPALSIRRLE
jgi:DNA modification methylase